jgi:hypothetical protein
MPTESALPIAGACRLVTRSDFDGLVCAALMKELGMLGDILFVHPKDVQDGKVELTANDVTTNLPYRPEVALSFDHHSSEDARVTEDAGNRVAISSADSAARVVYEYFGGAERFPRVSAEMMEAVDKADAAKFNESEILDPQGWILLSFLMDPRTGLGRFRDFRISNYDLMMQLIDFCLERSVDEILATPDVAERVELYPPLRTWRSASSSTVSTPTPRSSRSGVAPPFTGASSCSTCARRSSSIRPTASWSTRCTLGARSPSTSCGACAGRTRCWRSAARSSIARRGSTSAG